MIPQRVKKIYSFEPCVNKSIEQQDSANKEISDL